MKKCANILFIFIFLLSAVFIPVSAAPVSYNIDFELNAQSVLLVNLDTNTVVYDKNADDHMEPASLTKIMVAYMALENIPDLSTMITVPEGLLTQLSGTNSSLSGIRTGETLSAEDLLYCLMVPSGNDAAMVFASYLGNGNVGAFVQMMNEKAKELGMNGTNFVNPHGLHDPSHYTTARDLATLVQHILNSEYSETFMTVCKTTRYSVAPNEVRSNYLNLATTNYMHDNVSGGKYYYKYTEGIKTGSTEEAGYCLVTTAYNAKVDYRYLCICLGAPLRDAEGKRKDNGAMLDSINLYNWAFETFTYQTLVDAGMPAAEVKINYAWEKDTVMLVPETDFGALVPAEINAKSVVLEPNGDLPESVDAPIEKGQILGTAKVTYAGMELGQVNLIVNETVEASQLLLLKEQVGKFLSSKWLKLGVVVFAILLVLYLIVSLIYNIRKMKNRRRTQHNTNRTNRYR